ncbi:histidine utilization repressor [Kiloniella litopenaei]|uniref:Histidine utilization repressor n=1 Tax=Kiloniella litopenaei TaxID=1549748 RepID=A0A0M2RAJ1_9PROT|nr:histidine utilization repressor [Kiloniella litopenaei]KKJ77439.1 histidine utilization repressor [Kiloniella litopenaei]
MDAGSLDKKVPLYQKVKEHIIEHIQSGQWKPGFQIPSENELTQSQNMSRMTIHRALRELTADGWLMRVQGAGTFVAEPRPQSAVLSIKSIAEEVRSRNSEYSNDIILLAQEKASAHIAGVMDLELNAPVFHSIIIHKENDVPIQLEDRFVNPAAAPDYLNQDFSNITPYDYLVKAAPLDNAEHSIFAIAPEDKQAELLQIPLGTPCLLLRRRTWSERKTVTYAKLIHPGDRYSLGGTFQG